ncbi:MAG: hypothetical protein WDN47_00505 [Candidatus Doudnabacteria bacterium]
MLETIERPSEELEISGPEKTQSFRELEITPKIQKILVEKSKKYGIDFFDLDDPVQEPLRNLYFSLPGQISSGSKHIDDIDNEIEKAIEQVKAAKEKSEEEKKFLH